MRTIKIIFNSYLLARVVKLCLQPTWMLTLIFITARWEQLSTSSIHLVKSQRFSGLDINVCPIPVKTDVGQEDLVLRLSVGISKKIRDSQACRYDGQIYFHWYRILGLLYKRALFDLQFVHNLFWLKLKWNARSKLSLYRLSFLHALMKFKDIDKRVCLKAVSTS